MLRRQLRCPSCGASWERAAARFCGACGAALHPTARPRSDITDSGPDGQDDGQDVDSVSVRTLVLGGLVVLALIGGLLAVEVDLGAPGTADNDVALPGELDTPAQLTPDQRESLERFDPDRLRCEPHDCEVARLQLKHEAELVDVAPGWLAVLDGTVLRVRSLESLTSSTELHDAAADAPTATATTATAPTTTEQTAADVAGGGASRGWSEPADGGGYDHLDIAATPPEQLTVLADGSVVLRWFDRLARLDHTGTLRWELPAEDRTFRHLEVVEDLLLVLRDDLPWPEGTTGPRATPDPVLATVIDPEDGQELWRRYTLSPRDVVGDGLLITTVDGSIEMIDMASGTTRWRRSRAASDRLQSTTGPWLILTRPDRAMLIDPRTGDEVGVRHESSLLTPLQPIGDLWVAAWHEGSLGGGTAEVALVAMDDHGQERWRVPLRPLGGGACCPAAIPWGDDTLAVFDPGGPAPQWVLVDTPSGGLVGLPERDRPHLPLPYDASHQILVPDGVGDRLLQLAEDHVALLSTGGQVRVQGSADLEVVSIDPFVVVQGRELLIARPVPGI